MSIAVKDNNLYSTGRIIVFNTGERMLVRDQVIIEGNEQDKYHTVTAFDRIDLLAYKYYEKSVEDSSKYWWIIADANNITNPLDLSEYVGKQILIPDFARINLLLDR